MTEPELRTAPAHRISVARRALVVYNPAAGQAAVRQAPARLARALQRAGWGVELAGTKYPGHATALAAEAALLEYPVVVAAGGDGTINEVIQAIAGTETALGVLPTGTVNLWAAEAAIPRDPERVADLLAAGPRRRIDLGRAGTRLFLLMAGIGFDAAVVQGIDAGIKHRIGRWAYAITAAGMAYRFTGAPVTIWLDEREIRCDLLMMVLGNTRRYAGSFRLTPHALVDDGALDVCIVAGRRLVRSLGPVGAVLTGVAPLRRTLITGRAAAIRIESRTPLPLQVDGDSAGTAPVAFAAVPRALRVIVGGERAMRLFGADR